MGRCSCCTKSTTGLLFGVCWWALHPWLCVVQGDVWWAIVDGMGHSSPEVQFRAGGDPGDTYRSATTRWNLGQSSCPHFENHAMADRLILMQDGVTLTQTGYGLWPSIIPDINLIQQIWDYIICHLNAMEASHWSITSRCLCNPESSCTIGTLSVPTDSGGTIKRVCWHESPKWLPLKTCRGLNNQKKGHFSC